MNVSKNSLDLYFDQIYSEKIKFEISHEEVAAIQAGIEKLVHEILECVGTAAVEEQDTLIREFLSKYPEHRLTSKGNESGNNIIKVGSFYEKTKNNYPDEFDYIYIVGTFEVIRYHKEETYWRQQYFTLDSFHETIKKILTEVKHNESHDTGIVFEDYVKQQGPASKLRFCYVDGFGKTERLYVDIVPAFKIKDRFIRKKLRDVCDIKGFVREVAATGSYIIAEEVSFTFTEVAFMQTILSKLHLKAYRILKYIFNGFRPDQFVQKKVHSGGITTYILKIAMIKHHFCCLDKNVKVSVCVITVLETLLELCKQCIGRSPPYVLRKLNGCDFNLRFNIISHTTYHIKKLLMKLELMKVMDFPLSIIPISNLLLCDLEAACSVGQISRTGSARQASISMRTVGSSLGKNIPLMTINSQLITDRISFNMDDNEWVDKVVSAALRHVKYHGKDKSETVNILRNNCSSNYKQGILDPSFYEEPQSEESLSVSTGREYLPRSERLSISGSDGSVFDQENLTYNSILNDTFSSYTVYNDVYIANPETNSVQDVEHLKKSDCCACILL